MGGPELAPIVIRQQSGRGLKLAGVAVLAAGLAMAITLKTNPKHAPPLAPAPAAVVVTKTSAPQQIPDQQDSGGGIAFKEALEAPLPASQSPEACPNCWNKVHSGIDSSGERTDSLNAPYKPLSPDQEKKSQFALPYDSWSKPHIGDLPSAWEQCPKK
jgi:hypothetical protein